MSAIVRTNYVGAEKFSIEDLIKKLASVEFEPTMVIPPVSYRGCGRQGYVAFRKMREEETSAELVRLEIQGCLDSTKGTTPVLDCGLGTIEATFDERDDAKKALTEAFVRRLQKQIKPVKY